MIRNDPRMYSAGNVVINQQPHTALYAQLAQHRQARDEAFDEYIRNLNKSVNGAGVRNVDRPAFDQQLADWQKFGMQNRDAIRNRKGGADIQFQKMYQDIQNLVSESKTEEEKKKPLVEMFLDPAKRDRLGDGVIDEVHAHDQPIYIRGEDGSIQRNPNRKSLDLTSISFNPKPFEQDKYFKQFEDIKRTELPPEITTDPNTMTQTEVKKSVYTPEDKELIATRAVTDLAQNPSFRSVVKSLKPEDYNEFYKQNFGHDIQNDGDLAAAYTLKGLQQSVSTSKVSPDTFARQKELENIRQKNRVGLEGMRQAYKKDMVNYRKASGTKEGENILNNYIYRQYDENKYNHEVISVKGKWQPVRRIYVPQEIVKKYTKETDDGKLQPKFYMSEDMKYVVPVYPGESSQKSDPILIETFKGDLGKVWLSKKDAKSEMADDVDYEEEDNSYTPSASAPSDDGYSRSELKSAGWTDDQINNASKAGKIKLR